MIEEIGKVYYINSEYYSDIVIALEAERFFVHNSQAIMHPNIKEISEGRQPGQGNAGYLRDTGIGHLLETNRKDTAGRRLEKFLEGLEL